eukprot:TRINITY_DN2219_c3_g1_i1.p1 TRINITY_DN2219_c3_g1~~TRINITY_DN2219_c3_g1_i1.p1  ORF type:complete len:185 (+),score=15.56 TRINITY_DN2219_c3_g1_i1:33-557(+)
MEVLQCRDLLLTIVPYLETDDLVCVEMTSGMLRSLFCEGGVWWEVAHARDNSAPFMSSLDPCSLIHIRQVKLALKTAVYLPDCFHTMPMFTDPCCREEWQLARSACHVGLILTVRDCFAKWVKILPPAKPTQLLPAHHLLFPTLPTNISPISSALARACRAKPIRPPSCPVLTR